MPNNNHIKSLTNSANDLLSKKLLIFVFSFGVTSVILWVGFGSYMFPLITHHVSAVKHPVLTEQFNVQPKQIQEQSPTSPSTLTFCLPATYGAQGNNSMKSTVCNTDQRIQTQMMSRMTV